MPGSDWKQGGLQALSSAPGGCEVRGSEYLLKFTARCSGRIVVECFQDALVMSQRVRLTSSDVVDRGFLPQEISITAPPREILRCLCSEPEAAYLRQGFEVVLEDGMADMVRVAVAAVGEVARLSEHLREHVEAAAGEAGDMFRYAAYEPQIPVAVAYALAGDGQLPAKAAVRMALANFGNDEKADAFGALLERWISTIQLRRS